MKAIMLHIQADAGQEGRLQIAADLARLCNGRIACVQVAANAAGPADVGRDPAGQAAVIDTIHDQDRLVRQRIEAWLQREVIGWDWRCFEGSVADALITQSRMADLVVISQPAAERRHAGNPQLLAGEVIASSSVPVLVVPPGAQHFVADGAAILAWNGSAEAAQAMRMAVPLLQAAACVHVVEVEDGDTNAPATEAANYLARHGIACEVHLWPPKGRRTAVALLHAVDELEARFLVMGAYCRKRQRQTLLGDVTREMVATATLPVLLAH